jgi:hypothetical protein
MYTPKIVSTNKRVAIKIITILATLSIVGG